MAARPISARLPIMIGPGVETSARRAVRLALPFMPMDRDPTLLRVYEEECERQRQRVTTWLGDEGVMPAHNLGRDPQEPGHAQS